jgi:hypothetical protein
MLPVSNLVVGGHGDVGRESLTSNASGAARQGRRFGLRWALPFTLISATAALLWWSYISWKSMRGCDSPGPDPAGTLMAAMNAPILLARLIGLPGVGLLEGTAADFLADTVYAAAVGLLWVWVALNFDSLRWHRSVYTFRRIPLRITGDLIFLAVGAISGLMAQATMERIGAFPQNPGVSCWGSHIRLWWVFNAGAACLYAGWSLALVGLFGRDLVQAVCRKGDTPPSV